MFCQVTAAVAVHFLLSLSLDLFSVVRANANEQAVTIPKDRDLLTKSDLRDVEKHISIFPNTLLVFGDFRDGKLARQTVNAYSAIAKSTKGEASVLLVDCSTESGKRTCRSFKASPEPVLLKYFIRGQLIREFQAEPSASELLHFIRNPFESNGWQDSAVAGNVVHVRSALTLKHIVQKASQPIVLLIYIPLSELCEQYKAIFVSIAGRLRHRLVFVGADYSIPENAGIKHLFNAISIPMLLFLSKGKAERYSGKPTFDRILLWMENLLAGRTFANAKVYGEPNLVNVMSRMSFDEMLANSDRTLTLFYVEDCDSCNELMKVYEAAAAISKQHNITGIFAVAELSTWNRNTIPEFVTVVPMLIFQSSIDDIDLTEVRFRSENEIVSFMASPKLYFAHLHILLSFKDAQWPENVVHLTSESFSKVLRSKKHAMVLFHMEDLAEYGIIKHHFGRTAKELEERQIFFGAVNCQSEVTLCHQRALLKLPQINYYNFLKRARMYNSDFTTTELVNYLYTVVNSPGAFEDTEFLTDFFISRTHYLHSLTPSGLLAASEAFPKMIVYFFMYTCESCAEELTKFSSLAERTPSTFLLFAYIDCLLYYGEENELLYTTCRLKISDFCASDIVVNSSLIKFYVEAEVERTFTEWIAFESFPTLFEQTLWPARWTVNKPFPVQVNCFTRRLRDLIPIVATHLHVVFSFCANCEKLYLSFLYFIQWTGNYP
ncbi:hypothetical protein M513_05532 [Trichuris suis]|uniref:Thioredoxin domain-containing protein n=1 Tax=Trichuris suis TaxID=68888 RepID=A0A085M8S0_9BILA|nr:hypothetical protein M513_05532 [Trichuris suis]